MSKPHDNTDETSIGDAGDSANGDPLYLSGPGSDIKLASNWAELARPVDAAPSHFGRYEVRRELGRGAFGIVYEGYDPELERRVAIKVPTRQWLQSAEAVNEYLKEAKILASLDHPRIVPAYDFGRTDEGGCFVVSKLVEGQALSELMNDGRIDPHRAATIIADVAEALHYAHKRGLIHCDIKPANVLIGTDGHPVVADFGLALREIEQQAQSGRVAGTPLYMAPEQVRGERHRLDGRADVWALGVVFYQLLTDRMPFQGGSVDQVFDEIVNREPKPPRMFDDAIPKVLEQICLQALSKGIAGRYTTAGDLAEELRNACVQRNRNDQHAALEPDNLLQAIWSDLDASLQDAFCLAYNKKRREGSRRISTRVFFQALQRINDPSLAAISRLLPTGALPESVGSDVDSERRLLDEEPLLSDCIADSLGHFRQLGELPRKLNCADVFVDIGKHGHGASVKRLREHGVSSNQLDSYVGQLGLNLIERPE